MQEVLHLQLCKLPQNESSCVFSSLGQVEWYSIVLFCRRTLLCNLPRIFILPLPTYWHPPHSQIPGRELEQRLSFWGVFELADGCQWMCYCSNVQRCFINPQPRISVSTYCWESGRKGRHRLGLTHQQRMIKYCVYISDGFVVVWQCV